MRKGDFNAQQPVEDVEEEAPFQSHRVRKGDLNRGINTVLGELLLQVSISSSEKRGS